MSIWTSQTGGTGNTDHSVLTNRSASNQHPSSSISNNTTNFNKNLSSTDTDVQKALQTINNLDIGDSFKYTKQILTATDNQTIFNLSSMPTDVNISILLVNGIQYGYGIDYTIAGTVLTWISSIKLESLDRIEILY
jgi:hypothetical protein